MKKIPFVGQEFNYDCGSACATMVAKAFGSSVTLKEMTGYCKTSPLYGTPPTSLVDGLQRVGLTAVIQSQLTKKDLENFLQENCQVILDYWDYDEGHYVVLSDIINFNDGTTQIIVVDPSYDIDKDDPDPGTALDWDYFYTNWLDYEVKDEERIFSDRLAIIVTKDKKQAPQTNKNT